jgi:hypothetical protein
VLAKAARKQTEALEQMDNGFTWTVFSFSTLQILLPDNSMAASVSGRSKPAIRRDHLPGKSRD